MEDRGRVDWYSGKTVRVEDSTWEKIKAHKQRFSSWNLFFRHILMLLNNEKR